jgi:outer membrane protein TolC
MRPTCSAACAGGSRPRGGDADAVEADADAMRLAVVADTVRAYLDITTSAERLKVARETVGCSTGR